MSIQPRLDHLDGPGARSARYEKQRARIVDAAVTLVNDKGVGGMTLQQVAQALDLTTTSVTYYYRYKEQLAAAVFEDTLHRLATMVRDAAKEASPRARVASYVQSYFDQFARVMRGEDRPLAILSEIRTLEERTRRPLIEQYQNIFRDVRSLFGNVDTPERKRLYSARAQLLNEALFWSAMWLRRYPLGDLPNIRRRMLDVLENGIAGPNASWPMEVIDPDADVPDDAKHEFLRVANRLINDIGYKGASVDRIVGELKITKGSFYHHLDAKDDLILECYQNDYRRLGRLQLLIRGLGGPVARKLASGIASVLNLQFDGVHPLLRTTALQAMPKVVRVAAIERFDRSALWLSGLLVDGMADRSIRLVDPMIAANIIISTINSAYDLRSWARQQTRDEAIDIYAGVLMRGLLDHDR
ncbi:TetR/AcrR family transcriptional regulator [Sphingobium sp. SCG-1]|uniref:TetR/AcrR family transcriptional regulator n=1 Tax=Sphingobium sp. SCG-1 TaxID=2072936 RepID=UPI000CD68059|nr:TetR/AcrR family transcriptional regulator [Sphingobium sp. SCG-1]AUW56992.1 TetR/AcrR family transcriptional regulator [Sphingobium sp. SCG-1]